MQYYEEIPPFTMIPPELQDLLLEEGRECSDGVIIPGNRDNSFNCFIKRGKTTKMYALIDWVVAHTNRNVILNNFPEVIIKKGIPPHWRGRVDSGDINDLWRIPKDQNCVWLIDDSAVHNSSAEAYNSSTSKYLSKISGIISHLGGGQTLLYTTQNLAGVQKSLFRFTETVLMVGHMNISGLRTERNEFYDDISNAQYLLHQAHGYAGSNDKRYRDFYITVNTHSKNPYRIVPFLKPKWLFDADKLRKDMLSRPFRYMDTQEIESRIFGKKSNKKVKE